MNFKIDDILKGTVDGMTKEELASVISEVVDKSIAEITSTENKEQ